MFLKCVEPVRLKHVMLVRGFLGIKVHYASCIMLIVRKSFCSGNLPNAGVGTDAAGLGKKKSSSHYLGCKGM